LRQRWATANTPDYRHAQASGKLEEIVGRSLAIGAARQYSRGVQAMRGLPLVRRKKASAEA